MKAAICVLKVFAIEKFASTFSNFRKGVCKVFKAELKN